MAAKVGLITGIVSEETKNDLLGTWERIAEIGYKGLEMGKSIKGLGFSGEIIQNKLDSLGLEMVTMHAGLEDFDGELDGMIEDAKMLGVKYIDLVWSPCESREWILEKAPFINECIDVLAQHGLKMTYHNHDHEFKMFDGERGIDILLSNTRLLSEMDTAWVRYGGMEPVDFLNKYKERVQILHFKDLRNTTEQSPFIELGDGILDFAEIARVANGYDAKWFIVEQDRPYKLSGMESIKRSYEHLRRIGIVE